MNAWRVALKRRLSAASARREGALDTILTTAGKARFLGTLYLCGASLGTASLAFPHRGDNRTALMLEYLLVFAAGGYLVARRERLSGRVVTAGLWCATLLITLAIHLSGQWEGVYAMVYVWIGLSSFLLLEGPACYAQIGLIALSYGGLLAVEQPANPYEQWLITLGTVAVVGGLVGFLRRRVEMLLSEARKSERRLGGIMDNAPAIIYAKDGDGRYLFVNRQFELLFHVGRDQVRGKTDHDVFERREADLYRANDARVLEGRRPLTVEEVAVHDDGMHVYSSTKFPLLDGDDGPYGVCGISTDITARKRTECYLAAQHSVSAVMAETPTLERAIPSLLGALGASMAWELGEIWLVDEAAGVLRRAGAWKRGGSEATELLDAFRNLTFERGAGSLGRVWAEGKPLCVADVSEQSDRDVRTELAGAADLRGELSIPLRDGKDVVGVMSFFSRELVRPEAELIEMLEAISTQIGQFLSRKRAENQLTHQALHDSLTGLPNRVLFVDRLQHALNRSKRHVSTVAVLLVDADHFKAINDSFGHRAGDDLLVSLASRFRDAVRATETVARFGTDEFVVLCEEISSDEEAIQIAERIARTLSRPFLIGDEEVFLTASIGVALGAAGQASAESLVRDADSAMHRAKERGGGRYELFDERLRRRVAKRLRTENELRRAAKRDELRLFYQPIVALPDCHVAGLEALVRWQHPDRGLLLPGEFIPLAEESGLIDGIGKWVLDAACRQAAAWNTEYRDWPALRVSVNLSARQLEDPDFVNSVFEILRARGVDSMRLGLEITESVLMEDADYPVAALEALKAAGALLILDDFGTGYSSLRYLKRFPLDILKIDRSFVAGLGKGLEDPKLVAAMIEMARALGMTVIAEGVETAEQLRYLREFGCDYAQGFHFARPLPAAAITDHLRRRLSAGERPGRPLLPAALGARPGARVVA